VANFTPLSGAIGGALIGFASALLMLLAGRIAGISGIFGESLAIGGGDKSWRFSFILGLVIAPLLSGFAGYPLPAPRMPDSWIVIVAAGLLVGFGSRLGGGCTSGHGVCGIARLSPRSLMATVLFMATAMTVVAVMRHVIGA
jgi:uncharacterized membrane protein YedE/YeeE